MRKIVARSFRGERSGSDRQTNRRKEKHEIETGLICSITVFLPEVESDDFFEYEWLEKYLNKE